MFIIVTGKPNGSVIYWGPFITRERAMQYLKHVEKDFFRCRSHIAEIIVPNIERSMFLR